MKGYKFYLEYPNQAEKNKGTRKQLGMHSGNVLAVLDNTKHSENGHIFVDCVAAVRFHSNSPVEHTTAHIDYVHENCKLISEKLAREIHPELFKVLDDK
jgi:hypothetical protein